MTEPVRFWKLRCSNKTIYYLEIWKFNFHFSRMITLNVHSNLCKTINRIHTKFFKYFYIHGEESIKDKLMNNYLRLLLFTLTLSLVHFNSFGQTEGDTVKVVKHKIVKHDGTTYIGVILSDDGREVLIETKELGKIYIPKSEIASMKEISEEDSLVKGNFREAGPFVTRYYFTNNALPIKKGEDYAMVHLFGAEAHFSVANNLSFGVIATWIASPIAAVAKYSIPTGNEKINFSLGTIMLSSGYLFQAKGWGGLHWGSFTYGVPGKNFTLSSGFGYVDLIDNDRSRKESGLDQLNRASVSSIAGILPVGDRASFIFDSMISVSERRNYTTTGSYYDSEGNFVPGITTYNSGTQVSAFLMPGIRFQKYERRAFQVALAGVIHYSSIGFSSYNGESSPRTISFPVPMCSWFFKL